MSNFKNWNINITHYPKKDILDNTLENLKQSQEKLSTQLEKNQYYLGITYQVLANITKALGMLKHDEQY